jgi:formylglycine-generating enzyme required for sulfatase activity/class 3 adenylate cyclase
MELKRKLAAVLAADIVGYSKLMAEAEEETLQRLEACRAIFQEVAERHRGRIFNTAGDAVLAELPSALAATRCAIEIQDRLAVWNAEHPESRKMKMRMGITVGDVYEQDGDLLGDGVNIAARLQALATPGGIAVSRWVQEQVAGKVDAHFADRGEKPLKNIPKPVHVFSIEPPGSAAAEVRPGQTGRGKPASGKRRKALLAAASIAAFAVMGGAIGFLAKRGQENQPLPQQAKAPAAFTGVNTGGQPVKTAAESSAPVQSAPKGAAEASPVVSRTAPSSQGPASPAPIPSPASSLTPPVTEPAGEAKPAAPAASVPPAAAIASAEPIKPAAPARPPAVRRRPGDTIKDCDTCPEMIVVPSGSFAMGSPANEVGREPDEGPVHRVTLGSSFAVGRGAVTFRLFETFVRETGRKGLDGCRAFVSGAWADRPDYSYRNPGFPQTPDHPVVCVAWSDAKAFAVWLTSKSGATYRLPSEAEREYFTRAGTISPFWWGDRITPDQANFDATLTYAGGKPGEYRRATRPVFDFEPNLWGLSQVHGNVAEWTEDCWVKSYDGAPADGSARLTGDCSRRVLRGGAWGYSPKDLRSAYREAVPADQRFYHVGFRLVRELKPEER